jgi:hypothetical protein
VTPQTYEAAVLATTSWRLALSTSVDELAAIACTIRNHVIPRPGQIATYKSFPDACEDFLKAYPIREAPKTTEDALVAPTVGLLAIIDSIYECSYPDITATQTTPGARYFARTAFLDTADWRWPLVQSRPVLGTFGAQQFF